MGADVTTTHETLRDYDALSHESQEGILKTINVNIDWHGDFDTTVEGKGPRSNGGL